MRDKGEKFGLEIIPGRRGERWNDLFPTFINIFSTHLFLLDMKCSKMLIGIGNMMVELCSAEMLLRV